MSVRLWSAVAVGAALLVGCSAEPNPEPRPDNGRDPRAVAAALRSLDSCALAGPAGVPVGPHSCAVPGTSLRVEVGAYLDPQFKVGREDDTLDGVRIARTPLPKDCIITVLAGADLGIGVTAPTCDAATAAARTVIGALADPDSVALPTAQPDSCDLLTRVAGEKLADLSVRYGSAEMGLCQAMRRLSGSEGDGWAAKYSVRIVYGLLGGVSNERADTLAGRPVTVYETGEDCEYGWKVGPSPATDPNLADRMLRVRAPDCAEAAELATDVMAIETAVPKPVAPQRPVTIPA